jgi:hypothetical protein
MIGTKEGTKQHILQQLLFVMNHLAPACQRFAYSHACSGMVVAGSMCVARILRYCRENPGCGLGPLLPRPRGEGKIALADFSTSSPPFALRLFKFSPLVRSMSVAGMPRPDSAVAVQRGQWSGGYVGSARSADSSVSPVWAWGH